MLAAPTTQTLGSPIAYLLLEDVLLGVDVSPQRGEGVRIRYRGIGLLRGEIRPHLLERVPPELGGAVERQLSLDLLVLVDRDVDPVALQVLEPERERRVAVDPAARELRMAQPRLCLEERDQLDRLRHSSTPLHPLMSPNVRPRTT